MSPVPARNQRQGKALSLEEILKVSQERYPETVIATAPNGARWIQVTASALPNFARFLKEDPRLRFEQLCCLTGVDLLKFPATATCAASDDLVCVYDLHSIALGHSLRVKVFATRSEPIVPSVEAVWGVAGYFEREIYDLLGVSFSDHHDLRRLLMPSDWIGHPLRKDYAYPGTYGGVELKREGQTFESGPYK